MSHALRTTSPRTASYVLSAERCVRRVRCSVLRAASLTALLATCYFLLAPTTTHAQFSEAGKLFKETGTKAYGGEPKGLEETVGGVIKALLAVVGLVFLVLMVYGGYTWMTAQGVEENVQKAKKIITAAVIGLVVVMLAYAITFFVTSRLQEAVLTSE